jgi:glycosyltransferase involved in cell wall biosynthesis
MSGSVVIVPGGIGGTGGLSIDVRNLALGLTGRGWSVTIAGADPGDLAFASLTDVELAPLRPLGSGRVSRALTLRTGIASLLRDRRSALVHAFGCMPSYLTAAAIATARSSRRPIVWTPMFHPLRARIWRRDSRLRPMLAFDALAPLAGRLVNAVGAATAAEAEVFRRAGARRVELLPPVVEHAPLAPLAKARRFRKSIGVGDAPLILVVASRDEPRKGLDFAWSSFQELRRVRPDARLALIGLSHAPANAPAGVVPVGRVDDATLAAANRAADVAFVPSVFEAFSRVVVEAWQQQTPVVVSDGVAIGSIADGVAGTVVPYGDPGGAARALARLFGDPDAALAYGRAGRRIVASRFELDGLIDAVERLYTELV